MPYCRVNKGYKVILEVTVQCILGMTYGYKVIYGALCRCRLHKGYKVILGGGWR